MSRTAADRLRDESGSALILVMLVSLIIGGLSALALSTGRQAEWSSASDRNREQSLGVAEAGVNQVISRISAQVAGTNPSPPNYWALTVGSTTPASCAQGGSCPAAKSDTTGSYKATTPQGTYWWWVTRTTDGFVIDVQSTSGGNALGRRRHVQVTLSPPSRFADDAQYALFSYTSIALQSNDQVLDGGIFANTNISILNSNAVPAVRGSITAATGYIQLGNSVQVTGNVWSGGFNGTTSSPWAINLGNGATIGGTAMASATNSGDCASLPNHNYDVVAASGAMITGKVTTLGSLTGAGTGTANPPTCTVASPFQPMPTYTFNPSNYDQSTYHHFTRVADFTAWLASNANNLQGTFLIDEPSPSQNTRIDLSTAKLMGKTTIVSNAPIYTDGLDDSQLTTGAVLVLVSHYQPPANTSCSVTSNSSECSIHITNGFALNANGTCKTATLIYADLGPVAIKNGSNGGTGSGSLCGSVISNGILVKNQETVTYDKRIDHVVGFGQTTYGITKWLELPST